jgi:hypothetical protein
MASLEKLLAEKGESSHGLPSVEKLSHAKAQRRQERFLLRSVRETEPNP